VFFTHPISLAFLILTVLAIVFLVRTKKKAPVETRGKEGGKKTAVSY